MAAVQGSISLAWISYSIYLPKFIEQVFAYSRDDAQKLTALIFVIESAIGLLVEPFFGSFSDRLQRLYGSKVPFILVSAIGSTILLMGLQCIVIFGGSNVVTQSLLLGLALLWSIGMATFRSHDGAKVFEWADCGYFLWWDVGGDRTARLSGT